MCEKWDELQLARSRGAREFAHPPAESAETYSPSGFLGDDICDHQVSIVTDAQVQPDIARIFSELVGERGREVESRFLVSLRHDEIFPGELVARVQSLVSRFLCGPPIERIRVRVERGSS